MRHKRSEGAEGREVPRGGSASSNVPGAAPSAARLLVFLAAVLLAAGCATAPAGAPEAGEAAAVDSEALFASLVPTPERLVHRGITLAAPEGYRFLHPYGGDLTRNENRDPRGILFHVANGEATLSGSLQLVPMPPEEAAEAFLERYRAGYLGGAAAQAFALAGGTGDGAGGAAGLLVAPTPETDDLEAMMVLYPLPVWVAEGRAVLLELFYPPGDEALRNEAASIVTSLRIPMDRDALRLHGRSSGHSPTGAPAFEDPSGTWQWVTDLPGGMVVRRELEETRLYLLIGESQAIEAESGGGESIVPQELEETRLALEVSRGGWTWSLPVARSAEEPRNRYAILPQDPISGAATLTLILWTPERLYRDGRITRPEDPGDEVVVESVQSFFDFALLSIADGSEM